MISSPKFNITTCRIPTSRGLSAGSRNLSTSLDPADKPRDVGKYRQSQLNKNTTSGFTLIEVLLALSIIAIALTALLKVIAQNIEGTQRIKEKTISHWVAMQGVAMIQLGLLQINPGQETTQDTLMLGEHWYWRAKTQTTPQKSIQLITLVVSTQKEGPFREELYAFRYLS